MAGPSIFLSGVDDIPSIVGKISICVVVSRPNTLSELSVEARWELKPLLLSPVARAHSCSGT